MAHVFISYKHEDIDFAENLIHKVQDAGFETWVDNDRLHAGEDWRGEIDQAIRCAFALIIIMTPEAKASEYVTYEWAFASGAGLKIIPVLYKKTALHPRLEALQYLDFTNSTNRPWDRLTQTLRRAATSAPRQPNQVVENTIPSFPQELLKTKESWLKTGEVFLQRKDYTEALESYKQALLLDPDEARSYAGKSDALSSLERYKEALAASERAIQLDPDFVSAWRCKGNTLQNLGKPKEAQQAFDKARQLGYQAP